MGSFTFLTITFIVHGLVCWTLTFTIDQFGFGVLAGAAFHGTPSTFLASSDQTVGAVAVEVESLV